VQKIGCKAALKAQNFFAVPRTMPSPRTSSSVTTSHYYAFALMQRVPTCAASAAAAGKSQTVLPLAPSPPQRNLITIVKVAIGTMVAWILQFSKEFRNVNLLVKSKMRVLGSEKRLCKST
jgi:hypothetical protein